MTDIAEIAALGPKTDHPTFRPGDRVRVHVRIKEAEKERIQIFEGVVIARRGRGVHETFTVRKISYGVGVERIFPLQSPMLARIEVRARGRVRRSRLFYLRDRTGKAARIKDRVDLTTASEESPASDAESVLPAEPDEDA